MEKVKFGLEQPVTVGGTRLIPVSRSSFHTWRFWRAASTLGMKHAAAVLVTDASGTKAFRYTGEEVSLKDLAREMPAIKKELEMLGKG